MRPPLRMVPAIVAPCALLLAACGSSNEPAGEAEWRVLHATPALGPLDVEVGGITVAQGIAFGTASTLLSVPAGQQHLVIRSGNQALGALDPMFSLQHVNSVVVTEGSPQFISLVTPDTGQSISNRANLRFVNAIGRKPQPPTPAPAP